MEKIVKTKSNIETIALGEKLGALLNKSDCILLVGDLSAGKTTFTKGIGKGLGVTRIINSPTFTIVKTYTGRIPLYHLDLYILDGVNNDFDLEEYFYSDGVCVVEWPYQVTEILPKEYLLIEIKIDDMNERTFIFKANNSRYESIIKE